MMAFKEKQSSSKSINNNLFTGTLNSMGNFPPPAPPQHSTSKNKY